MVKSGVSRALQLRPATYCMSAGCTASRTLTRCGPAPSPLRRLPQHHQEAAIPRLQHDTGSSASAFSCVVGLGLRFAVGSPPEMILERHCLPVPFPAPAVLAEPVSPRGCWLAHGGHMRYRYLCISFQEVVRQCRVQQLVDVDVPLRHRISLLVVLATICIYTKEERTVSHCPIARAKTQRLTGSSS